MIIVRKSPFTNRTNSMDLPVTQEELQRWRRGELAQDVWPNLTPSQREFIISGSTDEDWEKYMSYKDMDNAPSGE
jgi:hypothetical protein